MCRSVRGDTLAVSRSNIEGVMRCAGVYERLLGGAHLGPRCPARCRCLSGGCTVRPAPCIGSGVSSSPESNGIRNFGC